MASRRLFDGAQAELGLLPIVAQGSSGSYTLTVNAASIAVTGQDIGLIKSSVLSVDVASYAVTAQDVGLIYTPVGGYALAVDAASFAVTFEAVGLFKSSVLTFDPAAYSVTAQSVNFLKSSILSVDPASYSVSGQSVSFAYTPAGSGATPAQIWAHELLPGVSAGDMLIALYQSACPTAAQNAAAVLAAMNATPPGVDVRKVNGYTIDGSGTQADPWGPA